MQVRQSEREGNIHKKSMMNVGMIWAIQNPPTFVVPLDSLHCCCVFYMTIGYSGLTHHNSAAAATLRTNTPMAAETCMMC